MLSQTQNLRRRQGPPLANLFRLGSDETAATNAVHGWASSRFLWVGGTVRERSWPGAVPGERCDAVETRGKGVCGRAQLGNK